MENNKAQSNKKKAKLAIIIILALFVVLVLVNLLIDSGALSALFKDKTDNNKEPIFFYNIDYDFDIFTDEAYLDLDRSLLYSDDGASFARLVTDEDFKNAGKYAVFFGNYFEAAIYGRHEEYNSFFEESYFKENPKKERFTMQMIYNMEVTKLSEYVIDEGTPNEAIKSEFTVRYAIRRNNGTLRDDLDSGVTRPQIYELVEYAQTDTILIRSISDINYGTSK